MTGLVGFIGNKYAVKQNSICINELSGKVVNTWQTSTCQLILKAPEENVAHQSYSNGSCNVDIFGDVFSHKTHSSDNWSVTIAEQYQLGQLETFLTELNGYFIITIFDKNSHKVSLISDRFGHRPLHLWLEDNQCLGFSSEPKGILLHPEHTIDIDDSIADMFINVGQMLGTKTLFSNIHRLAPATIMTIDTNNHMYSQCQYWRWSEIKKNLTISFDQAVDDLYCYFDKAMQRCMSSINQGRLAITLSGGLDSRVLLASAKQHFKGEISTFTFGQEDCDDAKIARQVSDIAGVANSLVSIEQNNWYEGRENGVWSTDGNKNILHMHALSSVDNISKCSNYLLNGYVGDLVLGGSYLYDEKDKFSSPGKLCADSYEPYKHIIDANEEYFNFPGTDPFFLYQRCVRFVSAGSDLLSHKLNSLKPFIDNDLIEYAYSLPDHYRANSKLYNAMLLKYYPDYFSTIVWQKTGKVIGTVSEEIRPSNTAYSIRQFFVRLLKGGPLEATARKLYRVLSGKRNYAVYEDWLKHPEFREYINATLLTEDCLMHNVLGKSRVERIVSDYFKGKANVQIDVIGCLLTLEIYLLKLSTFKSLNIKNNK
ncbi:asparagine synthase-related protein [Cognaticolwellia mytili]|uniref:asparagine synthase-related protein n=1 Tax=Cognaticolwellia mytili TaxID=1888913 RepID=UPI000A170438|nr:asparagine synthase-related protein [Cognaticolwellia mytili]